jgi:hypothetical protein
VEVWDFRPVQLAELLGGANHSSACRP